MNKDLTTSEIERQNVLNNPYALSEIEKNVGISGIQFNGKSVFLKEQVAAFYEVTTRTIENLTSANNQELENNGYLVLKGKNLKELKDILRSLDVPEIDFGNIFRSPQLAIFDFKAFLNIGMLLTDSERAKELRSLVLDIVIDTINRRSGGGTKYINQRDEDFLHAFFVEENYRKEFTDSLKNFVAGDKFKYATFTDKIYQSIFREKASAYRKILNLHSKDKVRDTFYSEILDLVASYEYGLAKLIEDFSKKKKRKLSYHEVDLLFQEFQEMPHWKPLIERARIKMASRDLAFRDALHLQLTEYLTPLQAGEFERFLGEKSKELADRLEDAKDVFKRLKERG